MGYNMPENGYTEKSIMHPRSPYGCSKLYGLWITKNYRESYNMFICNGILFNHEGERRGETFVSRKITLGISNIKKSLDNYQKPTPLSLGNLYSKRDWGYAKDYVEAMWKMLQQDKPDDYVIATGETHTVREFAEVAGKHFGFDIIWQGSGIQEVGVDKNTGKTIIEIDKRYFRPAEVDLLLGDATKAKNALGWEPKVKFKELVALMCEQ